MDKRIKYLRKIVTKKNEELEFETCTIKGVNNLSRSDRDLILMSLRELELKGRIDFIIHGGAGDVLKKAGLL